MIHNQAIVDPRARIADDVEIGPWTIIGPDVEIASGTRIASHVVVQGPTRIGRNNRIFQFASVGEECQDKKYRGEPTRLEIGDNNIIREGCTLHRGTTQDQGLTRIGNDNLLMAYVHVAHDCIVGSHTVLANNATLAGHVRVGDHTILGGFTAVHQFCVIGAHVMCGAGSVVLQDIPAFVLANGNTAKPHGINSEGLRRRGFSSQAISSIKKAYRAIYRQSLKLDEALAVIQGLQNDCPELAPLTDSLRDSNRGIIR